MELLKVENLAIEEISKVKRIVVDEINFTVNRGETVGIVGESGSGKTVTAMSILRLLSDDLKISTGKIFFQGEDISKYSEKDMEKLLGNDLSVVFQNPISSLNPLMKVGKQIGEVIEKHRGIKGNELKNMVYEILKDVGFPDYEDVYIKYPHELSGGQGQRIGIAMAIANSPKLIIADEPTTALDKNVQEQILLLLKNIQKKYNSAIIFISHDLGVIRRITDRAVVMYFGQIVEIGKTEEIFNNPKHPYTKGLLDSLPENFRRGERIKVMKGTIPSIDDKIEGCYFSPRCPHKLPICKCERIKLETLGNRIIRCINPLKEGQHEEK
ncbi:MAG: ABC transporter ATP-binding protein [Cetobacterium sp.]|nr:ABC transporter ATP-binding protein [Cetobacterium sp.]